MTHGKGFTLAQIAERLGGTVRGDRDTVITGPASIRDAQPGQITFLEDASLAGYLQTTQASAVLVRKGQQLPSHLSAVEVDQPALAFAKVLQWFAPEPPRPAPGIHATAIVEADCTIADDVAVGPYCFVGSRSRIGAATVIHYNCYIGPDVSIGSDCVIWPGVVIRERCCIGDRVIIHPNAVIGADGFGYNLIEGRHEKIPQIGSVIIEDDVEIGAGACVDRAKVGFTRIGAGTKIDNLVQVAHNVTMGRGCILAGQAGIAGSSTLGDYVVLGGQVGVKDHVTLGDRTRAGGCSGVFKNLPPDSVVSGLPARHNMQYLRELSHVRQLPKLLPQLKELIKRVERLESAMHDRQEC